MDKVQQYIKIPKMFIKDDLDMSNKKGLIISYFYFHTTIDKEIYTSIDCICSELNMSTKSHGKRRSQNIVKDIIAELIKDNILEFINTQYCCDFKSVSNGQLFKVRLNTKADMFTPAFQYVKIDKQEYDIITSIKNTNLHKIFNVFYHIKSYICMDGKCLQLCYPSVKSLCKECKCSDNTLMSILKDLYSHKLLYVYRLDDGERSIINNTKIDYVFALEQYTKAEIINEFAA